jgi:hypothetical protein
MHTAPPIGGGALTRTEYAMLFKVYGPAFAPLFVESIADLAELCGVTIAEARRVYYCAGGVLGGFEVLNVSK